MEFHKVPLKEYQEVSQNIRRIPKLYEKEVSQIILIIKDILNNIKIFEHKGAKKLQDYSK